MLAGGRRGAGETVGEGAIRDNDGVRDVRPFQHLVICLGSGWTSHPSSNKRVVVVYRRPSNIAIANKMNVNSVGGRGWKGRRGEKR